MVVSVVGGDVTGLWSGVGYWSALWTHQLLGFVALPLLIWHVATRPVRPSRVDLTRRGLLTTGIAAVGVAAAVIVQETTVRATGLKGARRVGTGSHQTGSFDPDAMPVVQWLDDIAPADVSPEAWLLTVAGMVVSVADLVEQSEPLTARLDCTGGWYADQRWDVVPVAQVLGGARPGGDTSRRSFRVTSATGYSRLFPLDAADRIHLAMGYDGLPLRRGHGAPVRLVVPGRRGPHWVKWVVDVSITDRPSWLQLPLPPT